MESVNTYNMRHCGVTLAAGFIVLLVMGCTPKLTQETKEIIDNVKPGMGRNDVKKIAAPLVPHSYSDFPEKNVQYETYIERGHLVRVVYRNYKVIDVRYQAPEMENSESVIEL